MDAILFMVSGEEMTDLLGRYLRRYGKEITASLSGSGYILNDAPPGAAIEIRTWLESDRVEAQRLRKLMQCQPAAS